MNITYRNEIDYLRREYEQKLVNKRNFLIINGTLMIIMGIVWLLYLTRELTKYSMLFYDVSEYAELAIILLLGVPWFMISVVRLLKRIESRLESLEKH